LSSEEIHLSAPVNEEKPLLSKWLLPFLVLALVIALDQYLKYWVKHNMILHTERKIAGDWFIFHFTENEGMAFGMKFFGEKGKYALSILRILVSIFGFWYLISHIKKNANTWFLVCVALILGGALGNIIDCVFYGVWYRDMNEYSGGYLLGWVVDMLYFPIIESHYPSWSPIKAGQEFTFFSPVFNLADAAISTGVIAIIVFQKRFFRKAHEEIVVVESHTLSEEQLINPGEDIKEENL
jgi:signal peptidase II